MKKIIAAFDGLKYSTTTKDYAIHLASQAHAYLVGVFLDDPSYTSYRIYEVAKKEGPIEPKVKKLEEKDKATRDAAANDFDTACKKAGIEYALHRDHKIAIQDLKHESIYADLLIIDSRETFTHHEEKAPTRFTRDLLMDTQCPVLITNPKCKPINKVVLLYDGEPSSVYAIKMLSYLLPHLKTMETEVISVNATNKSLHLPDNKLMKEFMKRHYPHAKYTVMKGWAEEEIVKNLKQQKEGTLVVLGAYRRTTVSRWFRESMADILMKEVKLPLFIAHNK